MKLLLRVAFSIIAVMLLAIGVAYYLTWTSNMGTLETQVKQELELLAFHALDKIDRALFERRGDLQAIASDPIIRSRDSSPGQVTERLIEYRNIYKTYASLSFFDLNRTRIADTAGLSLGRQDSVFRHWDEVFQGKLSVAADIGFSRTLGIPVLFFASPVRDKNSSIFGVLITRVPIDKLNEIVGKMNVAPSMKEHLRIDLVNSDGLLIYSNYNRKGTLRDNLSEWEAVRKASSGKVAGSMLAHTHHKEEKTMAVFCREQGYLDFKGNGWILIFHIPTRVVFAPIIQLRNKWLMVIVPSLIIGCVVAVMFSLRLSKPLNALRDAVIMFGMGKLDTRVRIGSRDEIGNLGVVFNQMADNLSTTTTSITSLEREIAERKKIESRIRGLNRLQTALLEPDVLENQMKKITEGVVDIFQADFCRIWLIGQGDRCTEGCVHAGVTEGPHVCRYRDKCLHLVAGSGRYTHLDGETHRRVPFGCYKIGGIASGEYPSFLTNDVANDPRVHNHEWARQLGLVSFAGVRLRPPHGETKGVLALFSQSVISDEEYSLLVGVGNLAMRVIETAQAHEALRESEGKYRALVETTSTGFVIIDLAGRVLDANDEYVRLTGHERREDILGRSVVEWTVAYDRERNAKAVEECVQAGFVRNLEIDYAVKNGQSIPVETNATLVTTKSGPQVLALCRDIVERKRVEGEIKKYYALFESSNDAIMMLSEDGIFFDGNPAAFEMYGFSSKEDFVKAIPSELSPPAQPDGKDSLAASRQHIQTALAEGSDFFEWVHKKTDGTLFSTEIRLSSFEVGGKIVLQALVRDITERKRYEEEREKLIADLRTSLAEIRTLSGLLPICASCKRIRDDKGYWNQIESYISEHSEAEFSHGICPECAKKLYPELYGKVYPESSEGK